MIGAPASLSDRAGARCLSPADRRAAGSRRQKRRRGGWVGHHGLVILPIHQPTMIPNRKLPNPVIRVNSKVPISISVD